MSQHRYYENHYSKKHPEEEALTWHERFKLRLMLCIIFFVAFVVMDGKLISKPQQQFLYQRLEEPMSRQTVETWADGMKKEYQKISEKK